ncbi:hypothetical protein BJG92_00071 [Arthrobacter sp. SO5]|uniref:hypothetical protein n=1 Tax=Arthrobacter sp. SO5 TaxID=1897055 RepID=UPI001E3853D2|nr:hypothetical protein [Arthrobacter sp. SO5]MCB5272569.1 hypothetical protein [Arthrobacter sp. SO5]
MDDLADDAPPLVAAPRHLRRRAFHEEIPDTLLVPDVQPFSLTRAEPAAPKRVAVAIDSKESEYRRKRLVALLVVLLVAVSVPALVIALLLAG